MKRFSLLLVVTGLSWVLPAGVWGQERDAGYRVADGTVLKGYLATDGGVAGQRPGMRAVHG